MPTFRTEWQQIFQDGGSKSAIGLSEITLNLASNDRFFEKYNHKSLKDNNFCGVPKFLTCNDIFVLSSGPGERTNHAH